MSSIATTELVRAVEANGGQFLIEGEELVIRPGDVAKPLLEQLRANKAAIIALLRSRTAKPEHEADELGLWLLGRCVFRDRSWTPIAALQLDCSQWRAEHGRPVCASRRAFVAALEAEGFAVTDGWCYGLLLKEGLKGHEKFQAVPEPGKALALITPAKQQRMGHRRRTP